MKKILITGANSYIGTSFEKYLGSYPKEYFLDTLDMTNESWKKKSFCEYDVVFHVAGIAHIKGTKSNSNSYYKVNRDLVYEVALKSKKDGVKQFIFLSSMSVYGIENGLIDRNSLTNPKGDYGKSKLEAEKLIETIHEESFKVAILRPPMVYGKGCKGNYPKLASLALNTPIFLDIDNKRSMIYIDNLCEFTRLIIENYSGGLFFPQNIEYVCTSDMVKFISEVHEKKIIMTRLFNPLLKVLRIEALNKIFGDLIYDKELSGFKSWNYCLFDFKTSIFLAESEGEYE